MKGSDNMSSTINKFNGEKTSVTDKIDKRLNKKASMDEKILTKNFNDGIINNKTNKYLNLDNLSSLANRDYNNKKNLLNFNTVESERKSIGKIDRALSPNNINTKNSELKTVKLNIIGI